MHPGRTVPRKTQVGQGSVVLPVRRMRPIQWLTVLLAALAYALWGAGYIERTSFEIDGVRTYCLWDDGMISMQYARNLARGHGLVWNAGEDPVQGFSNLGVTLIMAVVHRVSWSAATTSAIVQGINLVALLGTAALTFALARRVSPGRPAAAVAATLATLVSAPLAVWSLQGSDTGLMALWIVAALFAVANPAYRDGPWPVWLYGLLAVGLVLRADAVVPYVVLCMAAASDRRRRNRRWLIAAVVLVVVVGGGLSWSAAYYGDALPNTYYLKATGSPRGLVLRTGVEQLGVWALGLTPAFAVAAWVGVGRATEAVPRTMATLVVVSLAYCVWVGGDWAPQFGNRFFTPVMPVVAVVVAVTTAPWVDRALVDLGARARGWALVGLGLGLAVLANPGDSHAEWFGADGPTMYREYNRRNVGRGQYLAAHTSADTVLGVQWAGAVVYFAQRPAVDLLGKSDRHIARLSVSRFAPGHSKWDWDYVLQQRKPDVIFTPTRGLSQRVEYRRDYVIVERDGAFVMAMRRDALTKLHDLQASVRDP